jgi:hypothetical protein
MPQSHFQVMVAKMRCGPSFDCRCTQMETLCPEQKKPETNHLTVFMLGLNWKSKPLDSDTRQYGEDLKESGNGIVLINPCSFG